jgi:ATP-dependent DNA helicase RecG
MLSPTEILEQLNSLDETPYIEAKQASEVGASLIETVCAFANEPGLDGGYLLLGVRREVTMFEYRYEAAGIDDTDKIQSDLATQCATLLNVPIRPEMSVEVVNGKKIIAVYIPESAPSEKPVFVKKLGLPRGAYRRSGSTDQHGTEDDLIVLYAGRQVDTYDASVVHDGSMVDIDADAVAEYRRQRTTVNPNAEELTWGDEDLLKAFACARIDKGVLKPTVGGILLFGTSMAIRRVFPMMRIDYIRVPGREWVQDPDRRFDTLEIRTPLLTAIRRAQATILDELPKSFSLPEGAIQSEQSPLLPARVIREAIVNAVMHRSYRIHGPIQIIRYANRLEIRNPGHSIKSPESFGQPGSETRNPKIAAVLHEVNAAETKGSGIRVMRQLMLDQNLTPPNLESMREPDQFVATMLFHHFLGREDVEWIRSLTEERLDDEDARALVFVREIGAIDNAAFRTINQTDTLAASSHLRRLRDLRLLEKKGGGSKTYYVPGPNFTVKSTQADVESTKASPQSTKGDDQSTKADGHSSPNLPEPLAQRSVEVQGKRPSAAVLRRLIWDLCQWQPMSASDLANTLGRSSKPLVRDHLAPMQEDGHLQFTIPELPQHPDQKYRAAKSLNGE